MTTLTPMLASAGIFNIGNTELVIILAVVLLVFGPKKLPELSRAIGKSVRDFKKGLSDVKEDIDKTGDQPAAATETADSPAQPLVASSASAEGTAPVESAKPTQS